MTRAEVMRELKGISELCGCAAGDYRGPSPPYKSSDLGRNSAIMAQKRIKKLLAELKGRNDDE